MKKYLILILAMILLAGTVSAAQTEYNFNATYEGDQMIALEAYASNGFSECDIAGGINWGTAGTLNIDSTEPLLSSPCEVLTDVSTDADWDSLDSARETREIGDPPGNGGGWIFIGTPDENPVTITDIKWELRGLKSNDDNDLWLRTFIWDDTNSRWFQCTDPFGDDAGGGTRNCDSNDGTYPFNVQDMINSSGSIVMGLFGDWDVDTGTSADIEIDRVEFYVNYTAGTVTEPTFISPTPPNNLTSDVLGVINMSCSDGDKHYLWWDQAENPVNNTINNQTLSNYTMRGVVDNKYYYKAACFNSTLNVLSDNSSIRVFNYNSTLTPTTITQANFTLGTPDDGTVSPNLGTIYLDCFGNTHYLWFDNETDPVNVKLDNSVTDFWAMTGLLNDTYHYKASCFNATQGNFSINTSVRSFTLDVSPILNNCTSSIQNTTAYLKFFQEDSPTTALDVDASISIGYWITDVANIKYFNKTFATNNTLRLCMSPPSSTINANVYVQYNTSQGFKHRYYLYDHQFTNITQNFSLYNYDHTSGISDLKITVRNSSNYKYFPNIVGTLQRYYVGETLWRDVQMDQSGSYGLLFYNIIEENTDYRLIFADTSNNNLSITPSLKFVCTSGVCEITYTLDPFSGAAASDETAVGWSFNNATSTITITWNDPTGRVDSIRYIVTKETLTGTTTICDKTVATASGNELCSTGGFTGTMLLNVRSSDNGVITDELTEWIEVRGANLNDLLGNSEGGLWAFGFMLTIVMFGLFSPVGAIMATIFGLIGLYYLGIMTAITVTFIIVACVIGIIIGIKVKT